jgi:hypothetical protein
VQLQYPGVVIAFEKMLIAGCLPVTAAVQTWGMVAGVGMSSSCFFLAALLCALYYFFALPLPSSFHLGPKPKSALGGAGPKTHTLQDPADGFAAFVLVTTLPAATYLATHWAVATHWVHLWSLLLLGSGPLVFVSALRDGLWWLGEGRAVAALRRLLLLASLAVFLAALEERVVFHSFNQYIRLTAPWNYLAVTGGCWCVRVCGECRREGKGLVWVGGSGGGRERGTLIKTAGRDSSAQRHAILFRPTVAQPCALAVLAPTRDDRMLLCRPAPPAAVMYGVAALVLLHFSGSLGEEVEGMLVGPLLMLSAAVGTLAGGLPLWMLPAPLVAASGLAMFYDTRTLRDYLLFVAGALATGGWGLLVPLWLLRWWIHVGPRQRQGPVM